MIEPAKNFILVAANSAVFAFAAALGHFDLATNVVFYLILMMIIDVVLGTAKAIKTARNATSRRFFGGIASKCAGIIILFCAAICIKAISEVLGASVETGFILSVFLVTALVGELYSIGRNVVAIFLKVDLPEWNAWVFMIKAIRVKAESFFNKHNL